SSQGKLVIDALEIHYTLDESPVFNVSKWWFNTTNIFVDRGYGRADIYNLTTSKPSYDLNLSGMRVDDLANICTIDGISKPVSIQYVGADYSTTLQYCRLQPPELIDHTSGKTWSDHKLTDDFSFGEPVHKEMVWGNFTNVARDIKGGTVLSNSSEFWSSTNVIDGDKTEDSSGAWQAGAGDNYPWVKIGFDDEYYIKQINITNRDTSGFNLTRLFFSDGTVIELTLPNNDTTLSYNFNPFIKASWVNVTAVSTYGVNGGLQEVGVFGIKEGMQGFSTAGGLIGPYKLFNLTGYYADESPLNTSSGRSFSNVTVDIRFTDTNFTAGAELLEYLNGSIWVPIPVATRCKKAFGQAETNYTKTTLSGKKWYACYNDTDGDGVKDYFKVVVPLVVKEQLRASSFTSIDILDQLNYPLVKTYKQFETMTIKVNETAGKEAVTAVNITFNFNNTIQLTLPMANGSGGNPDQLVLNFTFNLSTPRYYFNLTARAYGSGGTF
ncbi:hypothetical protein COY95_04610, partial [Candidatus Woesearchaeota archaeon CG_4_10_14_0_8_um_filter_47_5]